MCCDDLGVLPGKVTDYCNHCIASGISLGVECPQSRQGNRVDTFFIAVGSIGIGMITIEFFVQFILGNAAGLPLFILDTGNHQVLQARHRIAREGRLTDDFTEKFHGRFTLLRRTQAA